MLHARNKTELQQKSKWDTYSQSLDLRFQGSGHLINGRNIVSLGNYKYFDVFILYWKFLKHTHKLLMLKCAQFYHRYSLIRIIQIFLRGIKLSLPIFNFGTIIHTSYYHLSMPMQSTNELILQSEFYSKI